MSISQHTTSRRSHTLSASKPVSAPAVLCWATTTVMPVRSLSRVRMGELKQEVCPR